MIRSFGVQTLTGLAQPVFTDLLTAAYAPAATGQYGTVTVANTLKYQIGDRIVMDPGLAIRNEFRIHIILSATQLAVGQEGVTPNAHAAGANVTLGLAIAELVVQPLDGNAGALWLGQDNSITNAGLGLVSYKITPTAAGTPALPYRMTNSVTSNCVRTADLWMAGQAGDKVLVHAVIV